ncbi:uncharacterized protein TNCV_4624191 [Trichonephila clavipes]|nr:uncharacterized protein TNCV_4624191 [Trichonephila clavipes]
MDEVLTTAKDMELEVNEDDIEELIMGHEDELTTEELQEILNDEHQETQRNVSPSEQEEDERGPMLTSAIKDLLKKWADVRAMVLEWHPNQADVNRVGDLYNNNASNYFRKILKNKLSRLIVIKIPAVFINFAFYGNTSAIGDISRTFEPRSDVQDDTRGGIPSPNYHSMPTGGF